MSAGGRTRDGLMHLNPPMLWKVLKPAVRMIPSRSVFHYSTLKYIRCRLRIFSISSRKHATVFRVRTMLETMLCPCFPSIFCLTVAGGGFLQKSVPSDHLQSTGNHPVDLNNCKPPPMHLKLLYPQNNNAYQCSSSP
ncbi:hypothetical protein AVEN_232823-1 [Araneus ventricosus]|uniref:Uncharacterized protein n=1 Tax=Araneus ventricosus TaxID=182803 RepID=A0A4Y2GQP3_ARAVE|nr:hypothetical protein AVEN_232823-1 [Araneus ventricosus]